MKSIRLSITLVLMALALGTTAGHGSITVKGKNHAVVSLLPGISSEKSLLKQSKF